jgi:hypothetical protein
VTSLGADASVNGKKPFLVPVPGESNLSPNKNTDASPGQSLNTDNRLNLPPPTGMNLHPSFVLPKPIREQLIQYDVALTIAGKRLRDGYDSFFWSLGVRPPYLEELLQTVGLLKIGGTVVLGKYSEAVRDAMNDFTIHHVGLEDSVIHIIRSAGDILRTVKDNLLYPDRAPVSP